MATMLYTAEFFYVSEINQEPRKVVFRSPNFSKFKSHLKDRMMSIIESYDDVMFGSFHCHVEQLNEDGIFEYSRPESEKCYDKVKKIYDKYEKLADDNHVKKILTNK